MYDRILVATDGGEAASKAVDAALDLAERFDATLHAVYAAVDDEEGHLIDVADRARAAGVQAETAVLSFEGTVHEAIVDYADEHEVDLVVAGTRGRTGVGRFVLGSVAEQVLRAAPVPVLTVRANARLGELDDVLVPTDGSDCARAAVGHAIDLAAATGATLHIVYVVDVMVVQSTGSAAHILDSMEADGREAIDRAIDRAERADVTAIEATLLSGSPYRAIVGYAAENDVDYTVVGTHGRTGFDRFLLGSVAERVVRTSETPVLAVKATSPDAADTGSWEPVGADDR